MKFWRKIIKRTGNPLRFRTARIFIGLFFIVGPA